ncbi:hypothetical protein GJ496_011079 [Pomphorhynchus laevis]|nr:hypothetical protein GJ496_011079 [Pomphorhynchus laevis]
MTTKNKCDCEQQSENLLKDLNISEPKSITSILCLRETFILSNALALTTSIGTLLWTKGNIVKSLRLAVYSLPITAGPLFAACRYNRYRERCRFDKARLLVEAHELLVTDKDKQRLKHLVSANGEIEGVCMAIKEKKDRMFLPK